MHYLLAIDQGTTSSRSIVFDNNGAVVSAAQQEFPQLYPADGRVEHDPETIWSTTLAVAREAMQEAESKGNKVAGIGITNQRETTIVWDRESGQAVYNAIVWQDRRTADYCEQLKKSGTESLIQSRSGLIPDPYFSASKLNWILDNVDGARNRAGNGGLAFGTVDSFLLWRLTGGKTHATDITNACRTGLFNIHTHTWDPELLDLFNIPEQVLPEVKQCTGAFGDTEPGLFGRPLPVCGMAGDQQAASIGQCCFDNGDIKSTYGTGCFVLVNTGSSPLASRNRLLTTIAYKTGGDTCYALEGSIFIAGAAVQWLRDGLGIIQSAAETERLARSIDDNGGVYMVPAFTGLGAPYWAPNTRGTISGLTRSSGKAELVRAALESVCYQTLDLIAAMREDGVEPGIIRVDGGMVANNWLMQFLADILDIEVDRPKVMETTALGAAYLAGLQLGMFKDFKDLARRRQRDTLFQPQMADDKRQHLLSGWRKAVNRVLMHDR